MFKDALGVVFWEMLYRTMKGAYQRPYAEYEDIKGPAQRMILLYQAGKKGLRPSIPEKTPLGLYLIFFFSLT